DLGGEYPVPAKYPREVSPVKVVGEGFALCLVDGPGMQLVFPEIAAQIDMVTGRYFIIGFGVEVMKEIPAFFFTSGSRFDQGCHKGIEVGSPPADNITAFAFPERAFQEQPGADQPYSAFA